MIIYITENLINGKKYIGLDTKDNELYLGSGKYFKYALKKYGTSNFKKTTIERCNTFSDLCDREKYWITYYNAVISDEFYNIAEGGNGGWLGHEVNEKRRQTLIGHKVSDETKEKIRQKATGRKASDETKKKMSKSQTGLVKHRDRTKLRGKNNPNSKRIVQYTLDGDFTNIWDCIKDVTDYYEKPGCKSHISACARGKRKSTMGFKWTYG